MPQKQPPAMTSPTLPGVAASESSSAGSGSGTAAEAAGKGATSAIAMAAATAAFCMTFIVSPESGIQHAILHPAFHSSGRCDGCSGDQAELVDRDLAHPEFLNLPGDGRREFHREPDVTRDLVAGNLPPAEFLQLLDRSA